MIFHKCVNLDIQKLAAPNDTNIERGVNAACIDEILRVYSMTCESRSMITTSTMAKTGIHQRASEWKWQLA